MASSEEVIVISDDDDEDYEDIEDDIEIQEVTPPVQRASMSRSQTRKRSIETTPPRDKSSKRMKSEHRLPSGDESDEVKGSTNTPGAPSWSTFKLPENAADIQEADVLRLLNGEEIIEENQNKLILRRLRKFTFYEGKESPTPGRTIGLHWIELQDHPPIAAHGEACLGDADLEAEAGINANDTLPQQEYHEILLDQVLGWWAGDGINNANFYIRTAHSWYLLEEPSESYRREYREFWLPHRLSQVITEFALRAPDADFQELSGHLKQLSPEARWMVGRKGTGVDLEDVEQWIPIIQQDLNYLRPQPSFQALFATRLVRAIFSHPVPTPSGRVLSSSASRSAEFPHQADPRTLSRTVVTPLVSHIAQRYYKTLFDVVGPVQPTFSPEPRQRPRKDPQDLKLRYPPDIDGRVTKTYYQSVYFLGKCYYEVGDCVSLVPGVLKDYGFAERPNVSSGSLHAKDLWYGQIKRIYRKHDSKEAYEQNFWAHIQWFAHGVDTDIGELAAPSELFLTYECNDVGMACISKVIQVNFLSTPSTKVIPETCSPETFYCRFVYNDGDGSFLDISLPPPYLYCDLDILSRMDPKDRALQCEGCIYKRYLERIYNENAFPIDSSPPYRQVNISNITYHINDTVLYIDSDEDLNDELPADQQGLSVGLIKEWNVTSTRSHCLLQKLRYMDEVLYRPSQAINLLPVRAPMPLDERRLFLTREITKVDISDIIRHCVVHCDPQWSPHSNLDSEPDEFFLTHCSQQRLDLHQNSTRFKYSLNKLKPVDPQQFPTCDECAEQQRLKEGLRRPYKENAKSTANGDVNMNVRWMRTMDLCAGAGALSWGFQLSGAFNPLWAIEKDISCAKTYRANFRRTKVYIQDLNKCARNALTPDAPPLESLDPSTQAPLPSMPAVGNVDAIIAGPPCLDFSIQNMYRDRAGESRTGLPLVVLSLIEHYRPRFFLIENVPGMLRHDCMDHETGELVSMAVIKIMLRTLTTLGYSVRYGLFNAANFGTPQDRTRLLLYGSQAGHAPPRLPISSHITIKNSGTIFSRFTRIPTKLPASEAPSPPTNIAAAIGDLPPFEWTTGASRDPTFPPRPDVPTYRGESPNAKSLAGFVHGIEYKRPRPNTLYQAKMRQFVEPGDKVSMHYTRTFAEGRSLKAARVISVPLRANMDHRNIPSELYDFAHSHALSAAARTQWAPGRYGRLDWQGLFQSAITRIEPTAKQGKVLHPSQRRLISIREAARGQGIPDHYQLIGDSVDIIRMIGNAVPVQLGEAFGRAFRDALIGQRIWDTHKKAWPREG